MGHFISTVFGPDVGMGFGPTKTQNIKFPRGVPDSCEQGEGVAQGGVKFRNEVL